MCVTVACCRSSAIVHQSPGHVEHSRAVPGWWEASPAGWHLPGPSVYVCRRSLACYLFFFSPFSFYSNPSAIKKKGTKHLQNNSFRRSPLPSNGPFAMEQIETQASDLRFLAQAQVPLSNSPSVTYETPRPGPQHQASPGSASFGGNSATHGDSTASSANKRKSTDDGLSSAKQTRSKRNRVSFWLSVWRRVAVAQPHHHRLRHVCLCACPGCWLPVTVTPGKRKQGGDVVRHLCPLSPDLLFNLSPAIHFFSG